MKKLLSIALGTIMALSAFVTAVPAMPALADVPQPPMTITDNYTLASDMTFSDTGFIIQADNITLDLNGHTVTGPFPTSPDLINGVQIDGHNGVTVKNGTIRGFVYNIRLVNSANNVIQGVTSQNAYFDGVLLDNSSNNQVINCNTSGNGTPVGGGFGLIINNASNGNIVQGNTVSGNPTGIFVGGGGSAPFNQPSNNNQIRNNTVNGNVGIGISIYQAGNNIVDGNTVSNTTIPVGQSPPQGQGIALNSGASFNQVTNNIIDHNYNNGIFLNQSSNNVVDRNMVTGNGVNNPGTTAGIGVVTNSNWNEISNNRCDNNVGFGILVSGASSPVPSNNMILSNEASVNGSGSKVDLRDGTLGAGTAGTANDWGSNLGTSASPVGLLTPVVDVGNPLGVVVNEGVAFSRVGSFVDLRATNCTATVDYGDGSGVQPLALTPAKTFTLSHVYTSSGSFPVVVSVTDGFGGAGRGAPLAVTVLNIPPTVTTPANQTVNLGAAASLAMGSFTDPGTDGPWQIDVDFGDGSVHAAFSQAATGTITPQIHTYANAGADTVTVQVTDHAVGVGSNTFTVTVIAIAPTVNTAAASNVATNAARLNGNLTSLGTAPSVGVSFQWGTAPGSYPNETAATPMTVTGPYSFDLGTLTSGATYYYRAKSDGGKHGVRYGAEMSFTTVKIVQIDIKPGGTPNSINLGSKGVVPVAVLTTADFDAGTVVPNSVRFAGAVPARSMLEDVNGDGRTDLVLQFPTQDLNLTPGSTNAILTGQTSGGKYIQGTDTVNILH